MRAGIRWCAALTAALLLLLWLPPLLPSAALLARGAALFSLRQRWRKPLVLFPPNPQCPNFLIVTSDAAGVGHRLGAIALAIALAGDTGAALVLDEELWTAPRSGPGIAPEEDFGAFRDMFALAEHFLTARELGFVFSQQDSMGTRHSFGAAAFATPWGQVTPVDLPRVEATLAAVRRACGLVAALPTGHGACTDPDAPEAPTYCLNVVQGGFERAAPVLRALYARSALALQPVPEYAALAPGTLAVAWHLRKGDIVLPRQAPLAALIAQVQALTAHLAVQHFVVVERAIGPHDPDFGFLFALRGFAFRAIQGAHFSRAFAALAAADVLVHTGSSFALAAAAAADASQVFLMMLPKEAAEVGDRAYGVYRLGKGLAVQRNGSLLPAEAGELGRRAEARLGQRGLPWRTGAVPGWSSDALRVLEGA